MVSPELLRFFPLFAGQDYYMLREIAMLSQEKVLEDGKWLFKQDDPALWFYLVLEGGIALTLVLYRNGDRTHIERMGSLCRGEILGWSSLVSPYIHTLGAQTTTKSKLVEIEAKGLRELLDDNPRYGYLIMKNITEIISERLNYKCIQLLSMKA